MSIGCTSQKSCLPFLPAAFPASNSLRSAKSSSKRDWTSTICRKCWSISGKIPSAIPTYWNPPKKSPPADPATLNPRARALLGVKSTILQAISSKKMWCRGAVLYILALSIFFILKIPSNYGFIRLHSWRIG